MDTHPDASNVGAASMQDAALETSPLIDAARSGPGQPESGGDDGAENDSPVLGDAPSDLALIPDVVATCDKDDDCARYDDANLCNGKLACIDGKCAVDPKTVVDCSMKQAPECKRLVCNPSTGACDAVPGNNGAACGADYCTKGLCASGTCVPSIVCASCEACDAQAGACKVLPNYCRINGSCMQGGTLQLAGGCTECNPANPTAWSPRAQGTPCMKLDSCFTDFACDNAGACAGKTPTVPAVPTPRSPITGERTGSYRAAPERMTLRPEFRWSPDSGVCPGVTYQIQIDDSCTAAPCAFPSPEIDQSGLTTPRYRPSSDLVVSTTPPSGTRYWWRVRACRGSTCSAYGSPRYAEVGRAKHDFNGDGYSELIVASDQNVTIIYGSSTGVASTPSQPMTLPLVLASAGDLNGDGYLDLIGSDEQTLNGPYVYIFYGSSGPLSNTPAQTYTRVAYFAPPVFGGADFDNDGYDDLIIGPGTSTVFADVFRGGPLGPPAKRSFYMPNPELGNSNAVHRMRRGDVDGDAMPDLFVSSGGTESLFVYRGTDMNLALTPYARVNGVLNVSSAPFLFEVGDTNGDALSDVLVTATSSSYYPTGAIYLYRSTGTSYPSMPNASWANLAGSASDNFGTEIAAGRLVGDDDVIDAVVSAPDVRMGGKVFIFDGSQIATGVPIELPNPTGTGMYSFGNQLRADSDFNGDGYDDIVVADEFHGPGCVQAYYGPFSASVSPTHVQIDPTGQVGITEFGRALH